MRWRLLALVAVATLVGLGAGFWIGQRSAAPGAPGSESGYRRGFERDATADLGAELMARVGRRFLADSRGGVPLRQGVFFYDQPKPYGHWLCRVNRYRVPAKIVAGRTARPQEWWDDDLTVERRYGVWRRPTAAVPAEGERERACGAWRDFGNSFVQDEGTEPERAAWLLDTIVADARRARILPYKADCKLYRHHSELGPVPCDAKATLARLSLERLRRAKTLSFVHQAKRGVSRDELHVLAEAGPGSNPTDVVLTVDSEQLWGLHSIGEGKVKAVDLAILAR